MIKKRTIGTLAALGGMTAAITLLAGLPAAKADELADLQANNQVLQQRLDQLAQVGTAKPQLPPGTASLAGSFPRSFLIPGTDTSLEVGGYVDFSANYEITGGGPNTNATQAGTGGALAAGIPLNLKGVGLFAPPAFNPAARQNGWFRMQASESRFFIETRTPTPWGEAMTHLEADFWGCTASAVACSGLNRSTNPSLLRLRLAYGTLGGFIAGQNWDPGNDLEASPEIFDFFGDVGTFGYARVPQVGYKTPVPWLGDGTVAVYAVQATGELATPVGGMESDDVVSTNANLAALAINPLKDPLPDGALVLNWEQPWGHFQLHGAVRDTEIQDGRFLSKSYLGSGGGWSGSVHPAWFGWSKDNLGAQAWIANGLGHQEGNWTGTSTNTTQELVSNFGGPGLYGSTGGPITAAAASLIRAQTVPAWGGEVNYQHWWTPTLRSTATFGIAHQELNKALIAPFGPTAANFQYNTELETAHLNLIWSPVAFINTGFEYTYDHRLTVWNQRGDAHVIDFDFMVKF